MNRHHSSWLLGCFGCYFFKSCRCWTWRGSDTHRIFSLFTFSGTLQVLKVSTNERTSWIGCVDEGDSVRMLSFENHFRDMFLNVSHIKCITFMHSFKAALITLLVTSWLNWPRHCMHIVYFTLWYEMIQATARGGAFVRVLKIMRYEHSTVSTLVWLVPAAEVKLERASETSPIWCGHKDFLRLNKCTSCQEK